MATKKPTVKKSVAKHVKNPREGMSLHALCLACGIEETSRQRRKFAQKRGTAFHYFETGEVLVQPKSKKPMYHPD